MISKRKKRIICFPFLLIGIVILGCTGYNNITHSSFGAFDAVVKDSGSKGFVTAYHWSGDPSDNIIEVPDTDPNGATIEKIGGFTGTGVPNMFEIIGPDCDVAYVGSNTGDYEVPVDFADMVFTLRIGQNINGIHSYLYSANAEDPYTYIGVPKEDDSITFYRILVNVECDPQNKYYYSKDGILYDSDTNEAEQDLPYEANATKESENMINNTSEPEYDMTSTAVAVITLPDRSFSIDFENNDSANFLWDSLKNDYLKITLISSGENKKVGELPYNLPFSSEEITTTAGDIILTDGNKIEFFYGEEAVAGTKIGKIYATSEIMKEYFEKEDAIDAEIYLEWTE